MSSLTSHQGARRHRNSAQSPALYFDKYCWIDKWRYFALGAPPPGCVWIRYGNDALLIDEDTGEVIQVAYEVFY